MNKEKVQMKLTENSSTFIFRQCDEPSCMINGTSLLGYIDVSYSTLVELFGDPFIGDDVDGYKTDAEWHVEISDQEGDFVGFVSIYNWKNGKNYLGADGLDVSDIRHWHVGGRSKINVIHLEDYIRSVA